jgi:frataxin-like iron-binding protein CyaY
MTLSAFHEFADKALEHVENTFAALWQSDYKVLVL